MSRSICVLVIVVLLLTRAALADDSPASAAKVDAAQGSLLVHEDLPDETSQQLGMAISLGC